MKKQNRWSIRECNDIIRAFKDATGYFSREISMDDMWVMFRLKYNFDEAETAVILASLIKAGAKFK